jgi:hypothetical protein
MLSFEKGSATTINHATLKGTPESKESFISARDASAGYGYSDASQTETTGMMRQAGSELIKISELNKFMSSQGLQGFDSPEAMVRKPAAVTSTVIQQVKALSEKDFALLILQNDELKTLPGGASKRVFIAFTVDLQKFHRGRKRNVFTQLQEVYCDPLQGRQKNILSTFVLSCLEPYVLLPNTPQTYPSARPQQVLLESTVDSKDPQVRMFLSMMGCTQVEAASPVLLALLNKKQGDVKEKSCSLAFAFAPHLGDYLRGIKCGNCETIGSKLKQCPCGKAYYCSTECQKAQWKLHKSEHKRLLVRKNATANN